MQEITVLNIERPGIDLRRARFLRLLRTTLEKFLLEKTSQIGH